MKNSRNAKGMCLGAMDGAGGRAFRPSGGRALKPALAVVAIAVTLGGAPMAWAQVAVESAVLNSTAAARAQRVVPAPAVPQVGAARATRGARTTRHVQAAAAIPDSGGPSCAGGMVTPSDVRLGAGRSVLINLPEAVVRRTQGDPLVVSSQLVSPQVLYLAAGRIGSTNAILQGRSGRCTLLNITVGIDVGAVKAKIAELLPEEKGISVVSAADSLVLNGTVSNALAAEQAVSIANAYVRSAYQQGIVQTGSVGGGTAKEKADAGAAPLLARVVNLLAVGAPQQVMLEVKVAEVSKTVLDQFGINFSRSYALGDGSAIRFLNGLLGGQGVVGGVINGTNGAQVGAGTINSISNGSATSANTVPVPLSNVNIGGGTVTVPLIGGKNATSVGVDAQKQDGLIKVLAEPTVMAISGQEGSFLAGGKIFIPVVQNNGSGAVTYTLEEKEFGVSLRFRPTVLADGRINLQVNPEVSELSATGVTITSSATGATTVLPAFTTRKASTTVQLFDGQSFAIGGLIKNNVTGNINAFPILGELPIIGALFRSTSFQTDRSELVFVITPRLVKPLPPNYALPTDNYVPPSRSEVILGGKLEGGKPAAQAADQPAREAPPAKADAPAGGGFDVK